MSKYNGVVGIDPGLEGALVAMRADGTVACHAQMPTTFEARGGKTEHERVDARVLAQRLKVMLDELGGNVLVACEHVTAGSAMSKHATCSLCASAAVVDGVCGAFGYDVVWPRPQQWQLATLRGRDGNVKDAARAEVASWPTRRPGILLQAMMAKKKNQGFADAALIAEWARLTHLQPTGTDREGT